MDLSKLNFEQLSGCGCEVEYISQTLGNTGIFINVLGNQSDAVKKSTAKELAAARTDEQDLINRVTAAKITGWRGIMDGEQEFLYSPERAIKLCSINYEIRDLVNRVSGEMGNYVKSE